MTHPGIARWRLRLALALAAAWLALIPWAAMPGGDAAAAAGGLQALALLGFVVVHAGIAVGWRGAAAWAGVSIAVAFAMEALSIATGVPFGFFEHLVAAPKLLGVPLYVPLGYTVFGWIAWSIACLLVRRDPAHAARAERFATPIVASFVLAGYDLAYDPIGSAVLGMWRYRTPGGQFGVPLSNFVGWLVTGWLFFQVFALLEPRLAGRGGKHGRLYWLLPCLVWAGTAIQYPLLLARAPDGIVAVGARRFLIADIYEAGLIVALLTALPVALAAAARAWSLGEPRPRDQ